MNRKLLSAVSSILAALMISVCGVSAAEIPVSAPSAVTVYEESFGTDMTPALAQVPVLDVPEEEFLTTEEAFVDAMREALKARKETFVLYYTSIGKSSIYKDAYYLATTHTGNPTEGDYILFQTSRYHGDVTYVCVGDIYYYAVTYTVRYYNTAEQEATVDKQVAAVIKGLKLDGKTDYEKVKAIYDYMCKTITYDYDHLTDEDYLLQYTAYAALINKTSVCQGYAVLFYRLALEAGVDARIVSGTGDGEAHSWNIVKLGSKYYNLDATWDAVYLQAGQSYPYFLTGDRFYADHTMDVSYDDEAFTTAYPISSTDYDPANAEEETVPVEPPVEPPVETDPDTEETPSGAASLENFKKDKTYADEFTDIDGAWYTENVKAVYEYGLMIGTGEGSFSPGKTMTVAEALVLACRLHNTYYGLAATAASDASVWYQPYVEDAIEKGIITEGQFEDYTKEATRAEIAEILAACVPQEALAPINTVNAIPDVAADAPYAESVLTLYRAGIVIGGSGNTFTPDRTITRAEIAAMVTRMADPGLRLSVTLE